MTKEYENIKCFTLEILESRNENFNKGSSLRNSIFEDIINKEIKWLRHLDSNQGPND